MVQGTVAVGGTIDIPDRLTLELQVRNDTVGGNLRLVTARCTVETAYVTVSRVTSWEEALNLLYDILFRVAAKWDDLTEYWDELGDMFHQEFGNVRTQLSKQASQNTQE